MKRDLVYFSPIPWQGLYQRPQHTARALAANRRVLFVEPRTLHAPDPPADEENLAFLALPVLPTNARRPALRMLALAADRFALARDLVARRQGIRLLGKLAERGMRDPVLLFGHPEFAHLRDLLPASPLAYDHMDDILQFGHATPSLRRNFTRLVRDADLLSATASRLADQLRELGGAAPLRVGNGVEIEHFRRAVPPLPEPDDLASMPRPRALYVGSVAEWFHFDLLFAAARSLPELSFPVVGPLRPALESRRDEAPSNVKFFGARPYKEVPAWLHHADAALIPFVSNTLTAGVDPVKIHEYLAAGLPVVATPFSLELREMEKAGGVSLADGAEAFAAALAAVLANPPAGDELHALAEGRSWRRVLAPLVESIDAL